MSQFRTAGSDTTYKIPARNVLSVPVRNDCHRVPILFAITTVIAAAFLLLLRRRSFAILRMTVVIATFVFLRRHIVRSHFCWRVLAREHELELLEDFHRGKER